MPVEANVTKKATLDAMVAATIKQYGTVDMLVNNAGIEAPPVCRTCQESQWDRVVAVNLKGSFSAARPCSRHDEAEQGTDYQHRLDGLYPYGVLRQRGLHRVETWRGWARQHLCLGTGGPNITVNTVCPGGVMTPLMEEGTTPEFRENGHETARCRWDGFAHH